MSSRSRLLKIAKLGVFSPTPRSRRLNCIAKPGSSCVSAATESRRSQRPQSKTSDWRCCRLSKTRTTVAPKNRSFMTRARSLPRRSHHYRTRYTAAVVPNRSSLRHLTPNVLEVKETFFSGEPLCGSYCAFGESTAGFGVVAEIDGVVRRIEHQFVHANHIAFAK